MRKFSVIAVSIIIPILCFVFFFMRHSDMDRSLPTAAARADEMRIGTSVKLKIEVADTDALRVQGLSGRVALGENEGLLFVFAEDGYPSIWMKDMRFPIDIIWINAAGRIVSIEHSVSPDSFPRIFTPTDQARYVLETRAGFAEANRVLVGDSTDIGGRFQARVEIE